MFFFTSARYKHTPQGKQIIHQGSCFGSACNWGVEFR